MDMRKIIFTILLIAFGSFNLFAQSEITQEEYDFYSKFLSKDAVLNRNTVMEEIEGRVKKALSKLPKDLVADFLKKNEQSSRIENKLKGFEFPDQADPTWNIYNKDKNEIHFVYQKHQYVSRVGFSKGGKYALVYRATSTDGIADGGSFIIWLVREQSSWKEKKSFLVWEY
ncbi:MAG: hypothetical protein ACR2GD_10710 [Pyrinomonadaceae bacterium]